MWATSRQKSEKDGDHRCEQCPAIKHGLQVEPQEVDRELEHQIGEDHPYGDKIGIGNGSADKAGTGGKGSIPLDSETWGEAHAYRQCAADNAKKRRRPVEGTGGEHGIHINLKGDKRRQHHAGDQYHHPQFVEKPRRGIIMFGLDAGIGCRMTATQEVTAMDGVDNPAAERANSKAEHDHRKAGDRLARDQKKGRVAHGRRQRRHNAAKGQPPGDILRDHDNGTAASRQRAKSGSHRNLPDGVALQHRRGVDLQGAFQPVDDQEGRGDKGADLKIGVGNRSEDDIKKFAFGVQHQHGGKQGWRQDEDNAQPARVALRGQFGNVGFA